MGPVATRILWGLLLAPPVLAIIYFGPPWSDLMVVLAAGIMQWEWARITNGGSLDTVAWGSVAIVVLSLGSATYWSVEWASILLALGALVCWGATGSVQILRRGAWLALGIIYIAVTCYFFTRLRGDSVAGLEIIVWLLAVVWSTDSFAYFIGKGLGGPKLAPRISPKKTWSGLIGGMLAAIWAGYFCDLAFQWDDPFATMIISGLLAVIAQAGDLFESHLKRRHKVKDSSQLIPGHGGLLDRADGLLSVCLAAGLGLEFFGNGP